MGRCAFWLSGPRNTRVMCCAGRACPDTPPPPASFKPGFTEKRYVVAFLHHLPQEKLPGPEDEEGLGVQAPSPVSTAVSHWAPSSLGLGSPFR